MSEKEAKVAFVNRSLLNSFYTVISNLSSKIITFVFTVLLIRIVSKENYGISKTYFDIIYGLTLFFPRETIRKTSQKYSADPDLTIEMANFNETAKLNLRIVCVCGVIVFSGLFFFSNETFELRFHLFFYLISAILELLVEPVILFMNLKLEFKFKVLAQTLMSLGKIISNYFLALLLNLGLESFTISRVIGSSLYFIYLLYVAKFKLNLSVNQILPFHNFLGNLPSELKVVYFSFIQNSGLKMILAKLDEFMLGFFVNFSQEIKAEYSFVIENFGLIARYVLEPVEENFYNLISRLKKDEKSSKLSILQNSIKFMFIFGSLMAFYIFVVGKDAVQFLYTEKWANERTMIIIKMYSIYIGLMSINGIVEAFTSATANEYKMKIFRGVMVFKSVLLLVLIVAMTRNEISGLILSNMICMSLGLMTNLYLSVEPETKTSLKNSIFFIFGFIYDSLYKLSSFLSIIISISIVLLSKKVRFIDRYNPVFIGVSFIIFVLNVLVIYKAEKNGFKKFFEKLKSD